MTVAVYVPLLLAVLLAVVSRRVARALSPASAASALLGAAALTAAGSTWGLALLAATLVNDLPPVTERLAVPLVGGDPVPAIVAAVAMGMLTVGACRLVVKTRTRQLTYRAVREICQHSTATELVVVSADEPQAFAVPGRIGRSGHILVTSGMLAALDQEERAVLLAHERAHLRDGHHWRRAVVEAAAAVNPLLRPTRDAVALLLERCADEAAADAVGSREAVARSVARAALAGAAARRGVPLAFERFAVTTRVAALQVAPPPRRPVIAAGVVLLGFATMLAAGDATLAFAEFLERVLPGGV